MFIEEKFIKETRNQAIIENSLQPQHRVLWVTRVCNSFLTRVRVELFRIRNGPLPMQLPSLKCGKQISRVAVTSTCKIRAKGERTRIGNLVTNTITKTKLTVFFRRSTDVTLRQVGDKFIVEVLKFLWRGNFEHGQWSDSVNVSKLVH